MLGDSAIWGDCGSQRSSTGLYKKKKKKKKKANFLDENLGKKNYYRCNIGQC